METNVPKRKEPAKSLRIKVISMGNAEVGKSCIIKRYCEKRFVSKYLATIGIDYGVTKVQVRDREIKVNIFDMAGHPFFFELLPGVQIFLFDRTKATVFFLNPSSPKCVLAQHIHREHPQPSTSVIPSPHPLVKLPLLAVPRQVSPGACQGQGSLSSMEEHAVSIRCPRRNFLRPL
ncbi:dnaJ homolog subfamily C member 27 isoform X2 [Mus musculus]|uniref:dnaJ homolog subfamily C member 27 isoform X2 n=1 Tax=Mus musculus TaxID=10090 RepID=UPI0003D741F7|nr:dnaJ homolog subfamily C member 27 isoform X2 [Mus musculus]|eukprot:XP_006515116.1 PREDICTED: dnaJ homolog subfamily C member 27 isoform X2 [Mus musculus]